MKTLSAALPRPLPATPGASQRPPNPLFKNDRRDEICSPEADRFTATPALHGRWPGQGGFSRRRRCHARPVDDDDAKTYLREDLRSIRSSILSKVDGLTEYDVRRPLTRTGTNVLGLIKHLTLSEARYLGDIFGRPYPESIPNFDDPHYSNRDSLWVTERESRDDVLDGYRRACAHADATIEALPIDATGFVPWWPQPAVRLFNVMVHVLTETTRHAGHADILREQLADVAASDLETAEDDWAAHRSRIDAAARAAASDR